MIIVEQILSSMDLIVEDDGEMRQIVCDSTEGLCVGDVVDIVNSRLSEDELVYYILRDDASTQKRASIIANKFATLKG